MHGGPRCVCTQCLSPHMSEFAECFLLSIMTSFLWLHILHTNCPQLSLFQSWAPLSELYSMTWKNQTSLSLAIGSYSLTLMQWSSCLRKAVRFLFHDSKMFWLSSGQWFIKMSLQVSWPSRQRSLSIWWWTSQIQTWTLCTVTWLPRYSRWDFYCLSMLLWFFDWSHDLWLSLIDLAHVRWNFAFNVWWGLKG